MHRQNGNGDRPRPSKSGRRGEDTSSDDERLSSSRGDLVRRLSSTHRNSGKVLGGPAVDYTPGRRSSAVGESSAPPRSSAPATATPATPKAAAGPAPIFTGLLAATVTPFLSNGKLDADAVAVYGRALKEDGISGVFCNGTTGESMSLSLRERKVLTERWIATGLKVCTHIGCQSLEECCEMAEHAQQVGADAIAVMCPSFFKPLSVQEYVDFLSKVSAAAPRIPLLVYHFPVITGIPFRLVDILKACISRGTVPNLRGAKFTSLDLGDFVACQALKGAVTELMYSHEQNIAGAALLGATSYVGMQFSVVGPLYARLAAAGAKGDAASVQKMQRLAVQYMSMVSGVVGYTVEKSIAATKYLTSLRLDRDVGDARPPGAKLTVVEAQQLRDGMDVFIQSYKAALASAAPSGGDTGVINVRAMEGFRGLLDDKIAARVEEVGRRISVKNLLARFPHLHQSNWRPRLPAEDADAAQFIDHTVLKPECTADEVTKLCKEAKQHHFYAVCVNGSRCEQCLTELRGSGVKVACVIGFPLGAGTIKAKAKETRELVRMGADEIDMVMNVGAFKDGDYGYVYDDIRAVVEAASPAIVKVIFETCLLNRDECIDACILSVAAGAHFVKTSTGFNKGGATPEMIDAMLATVGNEALVKASGGVRDAAAAIAYITAGVRRIGTSSGVAIVSGKKATTGY